MWGSGAGQLEAGLAAIHYSPLIPPRPTLCRPTADSSPTAILQSPFHCHLSLNRSPNQMRLKNRVALITGGAGSMGSEQARLFAQEGAAVCIADLDPGKATAVASEIEQAGGRALPLQLDVCQTDQWDAAVRQAEETFGHLDTLCNIAGSNFRVSFEDQSEEMWRQLIDTNLTAYFVGTKAVIPALRRAGGGVILNVGSLGTLRQGAGSPAYGVSKIGLLGLTRSTAASYAADRIRCVLICPGHVDTNFIRGDNPHSPNSWATSIDNPENYERRRQATPLGRLCTPADVAKAFLFAASDDASMITGSTITVDGGAGI
ncbi:MAG: SDR family oxidoreductase [Candidatus Latescibacteria bacterium]|nr:SDR family oxidoreductase [Candidatus Latescibacterota bacterium]